MEREHETMALWVSYIGWRVYSDTRKNLRDKKLCMSTTGPIHTNLKHKKEVYF